MCEGGEGSALCERGRGERNNRKVEYLTYWEIWKKFLDKNDVFGDLCWMCV